MKKFVILFGLMLSALLFGQGLDDAFRIHETAMVAQKLRMSVSAENIANATTYDVDGSGTPYRKRYVRVAEGPYGVRVLGVEESQQPFPRVYDPEAPYADDDGYYHMPNVNLPDEMVALGYNEILFQSNINALKTTKSLYQVVIESLK